MRAPRQAEYLAKEAGNLSRYIQLLRLPWSAPMGTMELPRVEHVFGLLKRKVFVADRSWNINIAGQSEHRIMFLKREEKPARELAQVAFALTPAAIHALTADVSRSMSRCRMGC